MTRDDIIRLAREAGIHHAHDSEGHWDGLTDEEVVDRLPRFKRELEYADKRIMQILERFATLVAAAEREACAMECIKLANKWTRLGAWGENNDFHDCAAAIRARG
jgi:hypothetical protein